MNLDEFSEGLDRVARGKKLEEAMREADEAMEQIRESGERIAATSFTSSAYFGLAFGRPQTEEEWLTDRPPLWRFRRRWQWAGAKPYTHTFTPMAPDRFIPITTTDERELPPEGTIAYAWYEFGEARRELVRVVLRELRAKRTCLLRAARGR